MKDNILNVRFTSLMSSHPPFSHNWPKFVPQPSEEPFVLYLPDYPPSRNLAANHHVVKDPTANDMDFENLMDMKRRQHESFGKYARRWRNMAVKVEPRMTEREMVKAFIRALEEPFDEKLLGLVNHRFCKVVKQGHATDNCHALRHEIQDLIDNGEFIPLIDVEQAYDPSMNMISVEESSDDGAKLTIPESEIIEKFSQMHLRLKGKTTIREESKPVPKMVNREEFLRLE
ncbi:hypothetical protein ACH5RR_037184 [Cinchona calisaya]|uniref:Uncharacterized protein n=1 Tax=Cinchona calisaya TaxID=153742 RepID=A0ABD2YA84_9GENT